MFVVSETRRNQYSVPNLRATETTYVRVKLGAPELARVDTGKASRCCCLIAALTHKLSTGTGLLIAKLAVARIARIMRLLMLG